MSRFSQIVKDEPVKKEEEGSKYGEGKPLSGFTEANVKGNGGRFPEGGGQAKTDGRIGTSGETGS